ncbi:MAG: hypothetical protein ABEH47_00550 [Haloferacaceae archaeon]
MSAANGPDRPAASYVPGMRPGATARNAAVVLAYAVTFPIWFPFLWLGLPAMVWGNTDDFAEALSALPGISRWGGGFSAAMSFLYLLPIYLWVFIFLPGPGSPPVVAGVAVTVGVALVAAFAAWQERRRAGSSESAPQPFDDRVAPDEDSLRGTQHQRVAKFAESDDDDA